MKLHEESGKLFTKAEAEAASDEIQNQLVPRNLTSLRNQVVEYREFLEAAEAEFSRHLVRINAEDTAENLYLNFCDAIESSL